jgi:hypothetical protein
MAQNFTKITFFDIIIDIDAIEGEHYIIMNKNVGFLRPIC